MSDEGPDKAHDAKYAPGHQPYDSLNGLRVGALAGAVVGVVLSLIFSGAAWLILVAAVVGAVAGFVWERGRTGDT